MTAASISALAIAGPALASNSVSTVTQTGTNGNATVSQEETQAGSSVSNIDQGGDLNTADVTQRSGPNSGPDTNVVNDSDVQQTGAGNTATVIQHNFILSFYGIFKFEN